MGTKSFLSTIPVERLRLTLGPTDFFGGETSIAAVDAANMSDTRQSLMNSYNDLRTELDALARDSGYNGNNLLMGDALEVVFNELTGDDRTSFEISAKQADGTAFGNITSDRLGGVEGTANNFGSNYELESMLEGMQDGVSELRSLSSQLGTATDHRRKPRELHQGNGEYLPGRC